MIEEDKSAQSQPGCAASLATSGSEPSGDDEAFTLVFKGALRNFSFNPFRADTPFGRPFAAGVGNAFDEIGSQDLVMSGLYEALKFVSTDPCFSLLGSVTQEAVLAALARADSRQ